MKKCIRYSFVLAFFFSAVLGIAFRDFNLFLLAAINIWLANIVFCLENIQRRFYFLMFEVTFFVFLLARPFISFCQGKVWWKLNGEIHVWFALRIIILSQMGILIGAWFVEEYQKSRKKRVDIKEGQIRTEFTENIQRIALIIFWISSIFYFIQEAEKLAAVWGKGYLAYYTDFKSNLPFWIYAIASFMKVSLCAYLATWPEKKKAFIPMAVFVLSAIPSLIIGIRNPLMLNAIFVFLYYVLRNVMDNSERWIGKFEKWAMILGIPGSVVFMAFYAYFRSGMRTEKNAAVLFIDFFYGQGVTFDVLAIGHKCIPYLPDRPIKNYTFGGILDYFLHGTIAQNLFGAEALDNGNSIKNALESNSFAHNMSYIDMKEEYLAGRGWGSSYLLETFADFGYIGIIIFSVILGGILVYFIDFLKKNTLCCIIIFMCLQSVFFMPRAEATKWFSFLFTIQFWIAIAGIYLCSALCVKKYSIIGRKKYV